MCKRGFVEQLSVLDGEIIEKEKKNKNYDKKERRLKLECEKYNFFFPVESIIMYTKIDTFTY